jgi:hypothetical protein
LPDDIEFILRYKTGLSARTIESYDADAGAGGGTGGAGGTAGGFGAGGGVGFGAGVGVGAGEGAAAGVGGGAGDGAGGGDVELGADSDGGGAAVGAGVGELSPPEESCERGFGANGSILSTVIEADVVGVLLALFPVSDFSAVFGFFFAGTSALVDEGVSLAAVELAALTLEESKFAAAAAVSAEVCGVVACTKTGRTAGNMPSTAIIAMPIQA